jgi:hypothetical protein
MSNDLILDHLKSDYQNLRRRKNRILFRLLRRQILILWQNKKKKYISITIMGCILATLTWLAVHKTVQVVDNSTLTVVFQDTINSREKWLSQLSHVESNNDHTARRQYTFIDCNNRGCDTLTVYSQYIGLYQLGKNEREIIGVKNDEAYWRNRKIQEETIILWLRYLKQQLQPEIDSMNNTWVGTYYITESGILAMAHLCGVGATKNFLRSRGQDKDIPVDGNNKRGTDYLQQYGRYNLKLDD